jgi:hypothetical protein
MTCRHSPGDTSCTSRYPVAYSPPEPKTPDKTKYSIVDFLRVGPHVVVKALYPNCKSCSYEGNKVMVFLNVSEAEILKWREIDPHFRDNKLPRASHVAPGPAARFPASEQGWTDAVAYATLQAKK